jgi:hypothetical protein
MSSDGKRQPSKIIPHYHFVEGEHVRTTYEEIYPEEPVQPQDQPEPFVHPLFGIAGSSNGRPGFVPSTQALEFLSIPVTTELTDPKYIAEFGREFNKAYPNGFPHMNCDGALRDVYMDIRLAMFRKALRDYSMGYEYPHTYVTEVQSYN